MCWEGSVQQTWCALKPEEVLNGSTTSPCRTRSPCLTIQAYSPGTPPSRNPGATWLPLQECLLYVGGRGACTFIYLLLVRPCTHSDAGLRAPLKESLSPRRMGSQVMNGQELQLASSFKHREPPSACNRNSFLLKTSPLS